jgi:uncharacterized protein YcbK (DUF882 family)
VAVNLHESLRFRPYDELGRPRPGAGHELERLLRCWHNGKAHRVNPRLSRVLYQVGRHFPGRTLEIFSGYRPRAYCTRTHSRHLTASAVDFRVPGVSNEALVAWLRSAFHPAGVGYYPNGVHVHLDVDRVRDTYWVDPGEPPPQKGETAPDAFADEGDGDEAPRPVSEPSEPPAGDPAFPEAS